MKSKFERIKACLNAGMSFSDIWKQFDFINVHSIRSWYYGMLYKKNKKEIIQCDKCRKLVLNEKPNKFRGKTICGKCLLKSVSSKCESKKYKNNIITKESETFGLSKLANGIVLTVFEDIEKLNKNKNKDVFHDFTIAKDRKIIALKREIIHLLYNSDHFSNICDLAGKNIEYVRRKAKEKIDEDIVLFD